MKPLSQHINESFDTSNIDQFEMNIIHQLKSMISEIRSMHEKGKSLKEIQQWSYDQRESGKQIPYLSNGTKSSNPSEAYVVATPTAKQKDLKKFFDITAPGSNILSKYSLYVYGDGKIEFIMKDKSTGSMVKTDIS